MRSFLFALLLSVVQIYKFAQAQSSPSPPTPVTCEFLDSLPLGSRIVVGPPPSNSFQPPTMDIGAHPFTWPNGATTRSGFAQIQNRSRAGGSRNEMAVNNLLTSISIGFGKTLQYLRFSFGEYGGTLNLSMNDDFKVFRDFSQIHGTKIGGVQVTVLSGGNGNDKGQIEFAGNMADQKSGLGQLAVGGQELWIDDICYVR